jgi:hypothetical protein
VTAALSARPVAVNVAGVVETPRLGPSPYAVDRDGKPYVPAGTAGVVRGVRLGDLAFGHDADHAAPGVTVVHDDQAARHALVAFACAGNEVVVRSGAAAGARGRVLGKRGEQGRVIAVFADDVLAELVPGDALTIRAFGQGAALPGEFAAAGAVQLNIDPELLSRLAPDVRRVPVRTAVPSELIGNGLGRPAHQWDLDIGVDPVDAVRHGLDGLRLGDLVAVTDLDVRHNAGYRAGWTTIGIVVHGASPLPGHGPGVMPILCGPREVVGHVPGHDGLTLDRLGFDRG